MKFKYVTHNRDFEDWELEDFVVVDSPLSYKNLPDGEYLIRGNKKEHRKEYYKYKDKWYLIHESTKDNGHFTCDATEYMLFPMLPEKEWELLNKIPYNRLNKLWQRWRSAHQHWLDLIKIRRDVKLSFIKYPI